VDENLIAQFVNQPDVKVIAFCGKNEAVYQELKNKFADAGNIIILGFYSPMDELYAIADVFITKPGGLSTSEALRRRLPMVISHLFSGQEQYNLNYLLARNLVMPKSIDIAAQALAEIRSGSFKASLRNNPKVEVLFPQNMAALAVKQLV